MRSGALAVLFATLAMLVALVATGPAGAADASWRRSDVSFVLLPGYGASDESDVFGPLVGQLEKRGWSPSQRVRFGYAGGEQPHGCEAAEAGLDAAEARLRTTIEARRAANPNARVVLVGHSLGGLVAWWHLDKQPDPAVVGVVAVDSPLHGVDPWKLLLLSMSCGSDTRTLDDLAALYADRDAWRARWAAIAARAAERGVHAHAVGNRQDCYYWPALCGVPAFTGWEDDRATQLVDGAATELDVPVDPARFQGPLTHAIVSHRVVLEAEPAAAAVAALVERAAQPR